MGLGLWMEGFSEVGEVFVLSWESNRASKEEMSCLWKGVIGAVMHWNCFLELWK
jgi:hypothetical protein